MAMDDTTYLVLSKRAYGILKTTRNSSLEAGDLISETLLKHGFGDIESFSKQMYKVAGQLKENSYQKQDIRFHHDRTCKKCVETKPSICFRSWRVRGYLIHDSYCSVCKNKIVSISKKKRRELQKSKI